MNNTPDETAWINDSELEQYSRRDFLEIRGIPKISSDTRKYTNEIVVELGRKIGVDQKIEDIINEPSSPE